MFMSLFIAMYTMTEVFSVRLPREISSKMKKIPINWSEEVRRFIEKKIREYELLELLDTLEEKAKRRVASTDSARLIREHRER